MPHETEIIIRKSLTHLWDDTEYPGVREHFTEAQLARIDGLETKHLITLLDKVFVVRMVAKLLFTAS